MKVRINENNQSKTNEWKEKNHKNKINYFQAKKNLKI